MKCKICNNSENLVEYKVQEMMFGFRDEFLYFQCEKCNCLQIAEIPSDMSKYYPDNYYSYIQSNKPTRSSIAKFLKKKRDNYALFKEGLLGRLIYSFKPDTKLNILSEVPLKKDYKILDVGCGSGSLLLTLNEIGFNNLLGIDPFLDKDIRYNDNVMVQKKELKEIKEKQDLIMFHHSFEHMANPLETLQLVSKLLNKDGYCIIRMPIVPSYVWKHYKEKWVQLDAPRHFFLHSRKSINLLAAKASFEVHKVIFDSTEFQFLGSERYVRDIPLRENVLNEQIFTNSEIKNFKNKARELNKNENGDACAFILKKVNKDFV